MFKRSASNVASQEFETGYYDLMALSPHAAWSCFLARHDALIEKIAEQSDLARSCVKGCDYCCHFKVVADAVEVFAMVEYVKSHLDQHQIDEIMQTARRNVEEAKNLSHEEHSTINQKCPLLVDRKCVAYSVRSIKCRNFHAMDVNSCRASFESPKDLTILNNNIPMLYIAATGSGDGFMRALHTHGYDDRIYDLNAAFIEAFVNPDCKRRYNSRKRAFMEAKYNNA